MKVSLSFFVIFMLLGLVSSLLMQHNQTGFQTDRMAKYYRGNADDLDATVFYVEKSYRQLLETTHFHIYIMPLVYLAFIHLYFLSTRSEREKVVVSIVTFLGLLFEIATPWLVRYLSPEFAVLFWISALGITIPTLWMSFVCLQEMWL